MADLLWSKGGGGPAADVQAYLAGMDVMLDRHLLAFDIRATAVHASGLARIGILTDSEARRIGDALAALQQAVSAGDYQLQPPFEDGHSAIEAWLSERLGDLGRKVHTGRSRNDQVQTALRLYMMDRLARLRQACVDVGMAALERAEAAADWPMPGYTHLQRAVPSTVGLWLGGVAEGFADIAELAALTGGWIDRSPLGTAAGYGVNLPLDRDWVAAELGFADVHINPLAVQNSRGRYELQALSVLAQATLELRRLAWDLSLYASEEFGFVRFPEACVTGSSIMPNKRNPDLVELLRAEHAGVQGAMAEVQAVLSLPSGYQRDLQATKPPLIRAFERGLAALALVPGLVREMTLNRERMGAAISADMYATDIAIERARDGMPFRDAYRSPVTADDLSGRTPEGSAADRVSLGACGNLALDRIRARLTGDSD